jgi:hypothetical protein
MRDIIQSVPIDAGGPSDAMAKELCTYRADTTAPVSIFDNYK